MELHRHFGLSKPPFELIGDPTSLFMSKSHREGLSALEWGLLYEPGSFTLLLGEVGTGKTTLIGVLLGRHYDMARIAHVMNPKLNFEEMLRVILEKLGYLPSATTKFELLKKFEWVLEQLRPKERVAIIVDEAQALSDETLEELRLFSNYGRQTKGHMEILLVGQPELLTRLMAPSLRQFHQRIGARAVLNPLRREEAFEYIDYKLREAGGSAHQIFAQRALAEIVDHSQGIPRQLNLLCNNALIRAYAAGLRSVSVKIARAAVNEYEHLGGTVEHFRAPFARQMLRSIAARPAISATALGLVALVGLYCFGVRRIPGAELMFRGETKSLASADAGKNREVTVNAMPTKPMETDPLQKVGAVGKALVPSLSPTSHGEAIKTLDNPTLAPGTIPTVGVADLGRNPRLKSPETFAYSVQSGDTIEGIAIRHFGSRRTIQSLIRTNPQLRDVNRIYPGDTVFLPATSTRLDKNGAR